jgi:hypothetical protein
LEVSQKLEIERIKDKDAVEPGTSSQGSWKDVFVTLWSFGEERRRGELDLNI